jgi:hypothetical protein
MKIAADFEAIRKPESSGDSGRLVRARDPDADSMHVHAAKIGPFSSETERIHSGARGRALARSR